MDGLISMFADDEKLHSEAVTTIKQIIASRRGNSKFEQYAVEALILLGQGSDACENFGFHPWQRFELYRQRGFYDPAFAACGWDGRPATLYFDAATRSTEINNSYRVGGMRFMLELADTERLLGRYDRAQEIDVTISEFAEQ